MELGSVFLILAVLVGVSVYLYAPLPNVHAIFNGQGHEVSALQAERDRVINSLQELDFDFKLGKIPAEDYPEQRAALLQKGADVLRKLDELAPAASSARNAEARIEKAAAAKRGDSSPAKERTRRRRSRIHDLGAAQTTQKQIGWLLPEMRQACAGL
jgi:hypothetical protein